MRWQITGDAGKSRAISRSCDQLLTRLPRDTKAHKILPDGNAGILLTMKQEAWRRVYFACYDLLRSKVVGRA